MKSFCEVLRRWAVECPDDEAFTFASEGGGQGKRWTYGELDRRARRIAVALVEFDGSVLLVQPPGSEFVEALFGCFYAGRVAIPTYPPHPMNPRPSLPRLQRILKDAKPAVIAASSRMAEVLRSLKDQVEGLADIPLVVTDDGNEASGASGIGDGWHAPELTGDDLAALQYTSGSTGEPRGVMLSHGNLLANAAFIARAFEETRQSRSVTWLPPYHDMGLIGGLLEPVFVGFPCTVVSTLDFMKRPIKWLRAISESRATISGGPSFAYDLCCRRIREEESRSLDLSRWVIAYNGSEPINPLVLERFAKRFRNNGFRAEALYPCYGLAESTLAVTLDRVGRLPIVQSFDADKLSRGELTCGETEARPVALVGCGVPDPDHECLIVEPDERLPAAPGHVGEIWVRGPSVAKGYWNRAEETQETFGATLATGEGPFLRTGDLGALLNGELFVTGRSKDLIIIRGRNYAPQDIEAAVAECHSLVRPSCGVAFSVSGAGEERLAIVQEVDAALTLDPEPIFRAIRRAVAAVSDLQPHSIVLIRPRRLPKTSSGKVQRQACRSLFLARGLESVAEWHAGENHLEHAPRIATEQGADLAGAGE